MFWLQPHAARLKPTSAAPRQENAWTRMSKTPFFAYRSDDPGHVGVIFAVMVAFAVIAVWEKFAEAQSAVAQEAGASATLYRLAAGSDPKMKATREAMSNYLRLAIEKDWPAMAAGKNSREVRMRLVHSMIRSLA